MDHRFGCRDAEATMNKVLSELHQDHVVFARALHGLQRQLEVIRQGGTVDVHVVTDLIDYMQNYPDLEHHPREDFIVAVYQERSERGESLIKRLRFEHRLLAEQSEDLRNLLDQWECDLPVPREQIARDLGRYVRTQWRHLNLEEDSMYTLVSSGLTADDWERIVATMPAKYNGSLGSTLHHRCECVLAQLPECA
jgi:hemerythrin-like domain-containing protein